MGDSQEQNPCSAKRLHELYERLREYVLNALDNPSPVYGLGVIVLRGMPAWIKAASLYAADLDCHPGNKGLEAIRLQPVEKTQLQEILADVLIHQCYREVSC
jgi:hypothetical protein